MNRHILFYLCSLFSFSTLAAITVTPTSLISYVGAVKPIKISGGTPNYTITSSLGGSFTKVDTYNYKYTSPLRTGTDTITISDSKGETKTLSAVVGPDLYVTQITHEVYASNAREMKDLVKGGVTPDEYRVTEGAGKVDIFTGRFVAPAAVGKSVITVTDKSGQTDFLRITHPALGASVDSLSLAAGANKDFAITGGVLNFTVAASGRLTKIDNYKYNYQAPTSGTSDKITIKDFTGAVKSIPVTISPDLYVTQINFDVYASNAKVMMEYVKGGVTPYQFRVTSGSGTVDLNTGRFVAPAAIGSSVITVTDNSGQSDFLRINHPALGVSTSSLSLTAGQSGEFKITGGVLDFKITARGIITKIDNYTYKYTAPSAAGTDSIIVKDFTGAQKVIAVTISAGTVIVPPEGGTALNGDFIPEAYAPGCTPAKLTDFMETQTWRHRRVEPRDCALVKVATPVFVWVLPMDRDTNQDMILVLKKPDGSVETRLTKRSRFLWDKALPLGTYQWQIQYKRPNDSSIYSTSLRRFVIENSNQFVIPSGTQVAATVMAQKRPRAIPDSSTGPQIAAKALNGEYKTSYNAFLNLARCFMTEVSSCSGKDARNPLPPTVGRSNYAYAPE
jgi:hypothetical protein